MKSLPKWTAMALTVAMAASLAACGGGTAGQPSTAPGAGGSSAPESGEPYVVGISQLVTHEALDAATQGFKDALVEAFGQEGVQFDEQNAANDPATCSTIANSFVAEGVDLILANATPALQAAAAATGDIPILGTSVTEYGVAMSIENFTGTVGTVDLILANATPALQAAAAATGDIPILGTSVTEYGVAMSIENFTGTVGTNVSGTSDLAPLDQQAQMIKDWYPDAETVGLLYCSNEPNSQYQVDTVQGYLEELGYTCTQYAFADSNDVAAVCQSAADSSDVMYIPTDNTCASNTGIIDNICRGKVPVFCGEEGIARGCGVATLSISYYDLGVATGKMAAKILTGEADVSQMPIEYAAEFTPKYNEVICADLGVTPPDGYTAIAVD